MAPSWSWASIDEPVESERSNSRCKPLIELVDVGVSTKTEDVTVGATNGFLKLKGAVIIAACHQSSLGRLEISTGTVFQRRRRLSVQF
jgi:hypothetical protein